MSDNKKVQDSSPGLSKQKTYTDGAIFSNPNVTNQTDLVNNDLGSPRLTWACFACGSLSTLTVYYAAGGTLAICASCENRGIN